MILKSHTFVLSHIKVYNIFFSVALHYLQEIFASVGRRQVRGQSAISYKVINAKLWTE